MDIDNIVMFHVLKGQISWCKDGQMGMIFVNTYFYLIKKIIMEKNAFLILLRRISQTSIFHYTYECCTPSEWASQLLESFKSFELAQ